MHSEYFNSFLSCSFCFLFRKKNFCCNSSFDNTVYNDEVNICNFFFVAVRLALFFFKASLVTSLYGNLDEHTLHTVCLRTENVLTHFRVDFFFTELCLKAVTTATSVIAQSCWPCVPYTVVKRLWLC